MIHWPTNHQNGLTLLPVSVAQGLSLALLSGLLLTACQQRPAPAEPETLAPASFSDTGTAAVPGHWWENLDDPALQGLIDRALDNNRSLRAAAARLEQARAVASREGAQRWPSLNLSGEAARQRDDAGNTAELFTGGARASWELDLWGRVRAAAQSADLEARASGAALEDAAVSLAAEVANAWFALLEARLQERILNEQLDINRQMEELIRLRFRQGQVTVSDVLRQEQLVEQTRGELVEVRRNQENLTLQLAVLVGATPGEFQPPDSETLMAPPPRPDTGVPVELLARRPDVRAALLRVRAADRRVAAAMAERLPRIDLTASITDSAASASDLFSNWLAEFSAAVAMPLFDAGRRRAEVRRNRGVLKEAISDYEQAVLEAIRDVEDALSAEHRQRERLESLRQQRQLAEQVLTRLRSRYTRGATDYLDVLDALTREQQLQRQVLTARRRLLANRITLYRTLAGGWEQEDDHAADE